MKSALCLLLGALLVACSGEAPSEPSPLDPPVASARQAIVYGQPDTAHPATVLVLLYKGETFNPAGQYAICTATIVAAAGTQAFALTAAHCAGPEGLDPREVVVGDSLETGVHYKVTSFRANAGFNGQSYDFGMLAFDRPSPDVTPIPVLPPDLDKVGVGTSVLFVGYGRDENQKAGVRRQVSGVLADVGPVPNDDLHLVSPVGPSTGGTCEGDSGGPALVTVDGKEYVAGVTAGGDANCASFGVSGRVSAVVESFIQPFIAGEPSATTCHECVSGSAYANTCLAQEKACTKDKGCKAFLDCYEGCTTGECITGCAVAHPEGVPLFNAFLGCYCQKACVDPCATDCALPTEQGGFGPVVIPGAGGSGGSSGGDNESGGASGEAGSAGTSGEAGSTLAGGVAGVSAAGDPAAGSAGTQATGGTGGQPPTSEGDGSGGCAVGHGRSGGEGLALGLLALVVRRRRRRSAPRA